MVVVRQNVGWLGWDVDEVVVEVMVVKASTSTVDVAGMSVNVKRSDSTIVVAGTVVDIVAIYITRLVGKVEVALTTT